MKKITAAKIVFLVSIAVVAIHFVVIYKYGLNIPDWDDYGSVLRFANNFRTDQNFATKWMSLFSQHNEHRIFFNRIVTLLNLAVWGKIDFRFFIVAGNLSLLVVFLLFVKCFKEIVAGEWWFFLPVPFLLFSVGSHENFLWAMASVQNISVVLFSLAALYFLFRSEKMTARDFAFACALALLATFTSGNGMITFATGLLGLIIRRYPVKFLLMWGVLAGIAILLYSKGYVAVDGHPDPMQTVVRQPDQLISHFFVLLGCITGNLSLSVFLGFLLTVVFVYLTAERYFDKQPLLFFMLTFLVLSSCVVSLSRAGFGVEQAMAVRYRLYSELIVLVLYLMLIPDILQNAKKYVIVVAVILTSIVLYVVAFRKSMPDIQTRFDKLKHGAVYYNEEHSLSYLSLLSHADAGDILATSKTLGVFAMPSFFYSDMQSEQIDRVVPMPTDNIKYNFTFKPRKDMLFIDNGWAFVEGRNTASMKTLVVFKSETKTYVFKTVAHLRNDVAIAFDQDVADSGFSLIKDCGGLDEGEYRVGFLIEHPGSTAFENTDIVAVVTEQGCAFKAIPTDQSFYLDVAEVSPDGVYIRGWVFVPNAASTLVTKDIILKGAAGNRSFVPRNEFRRDVSNSYGGAYDSSGFVLHLPKGVLASGDYTIVLRVSYDGINTIIDTGRKIRSE
ncbi:hypothetical protein [Chryseolinea lacunae]|uniref:Glycosyltransferase RgtA/B/C/D-like domain-containing protein n=1 Tax=Chryseolinea lacunae TaxID=2801331 RepID=A0ABS1KSP3_9BACT|nr:hypothetical protein [Chryseolinea lacunae]MBL0742213.1 hypothetical protein [Chryseolinea lacunae]